MSSILEFLDFTGLESLWVKLKKYLPFYSVAVTGEDNGWCKVAQIRCGRERMNRPFVFKFICRGFSTSRAEIMLASQDGNTPGVAFFFHAIQTANGTHGKTSNVGYTYDDVDGVRTYTLWKKKNERYGSINVHCECNDDYSQYVSFTKGISYYEPPGIVYAEEVYDSVTVLRGENAWDGNSDIKVPTAKAVQAQLDGRMPRYMVTMLADWNSLNTTGCYEVVSQAANVANSPEPLKLACYVTVVNGYVTQLAVGDRVYKRCMPADTGAWEPWVVLQDSSGTTANKVYSGTQGGYLEIDRAELVASNSEGRTTIAGDGITTPSLTVNSLLVNGKSIYQKFYTSYTGQTTRMSPGQGHSVRVLSKSSGFKPGKKMMFCMSFELLNMNIPVGSCKLFDFLLYNKEQTSQGSRGQLLGGQSVVVGVGDNHCLIEVPFTWSGGSFGIGVTMVWDSSYEVSGNENVVIGDGDAFLYQIEN